MKTFSIVFPGQPEVDEGPYSRAVAKLIGSEHTEIEFRPEQFPDLMRNGVRSLGEPCVSAPLLLYRLSQEAAKSVKTVISGEGSDELFAGYDWWERHTDYYYAARRLARPGLFRTSADRAIHPGWRRLFRVLAAPDELAADAEWYRMFAPREIDAVFHPEGRTDRPDVTPLRLDQDTLSSCHHLLERRMALEFTRRLPEGILLIADRLSMAHSLKVRMPFLDANLVEFAAGLPIDLKRRGRQEKYILSRLGHLLPPEVARRKKFGLLAPVRQAFTGPLRDFLFDLLLDPNALGGSFDRKALEAWLWRWQSNPDFYGRRPWTLAALATWWNTCLRRQTPAGAP